MASKRYPGNVISAQENLPGGFLTGASAPGVWSIEEAFSYIKAGIWPLTGYASVGFFGGGSASNVLDYIQIPTLGNAVDFGDLSSVTSQQYAACGSKSRLIFKLFGPDNKTLCYITASSGASSADFGELTVGRSRTTACSSDTRGVFFGGATGGTDSTNVIDYITIATTGDAADFGDLLDAVQWVSSCSSPTRGVVGGAYTFSGGAQNTIQYVTIASTGNALDFGDLTSNRFGMGSCSSSTRGVFAGSYNSSNNTIDYVTIASTGNATDFGDLTLAPRFAPSACSSLTRGVFGGGSDVGGTSVNIISYITIATAGNATDFGDLTVAREGLAACSNAHGGLA